MLHFWRDAYFLDLLQPRSIKVMMWRKVLITDFSTAVVVGFSMTAVPYCRPPLEVWACTRLGVGRQIVFCRVIFRREAPPTFWLSPGLRILLSVLISVSALLGADTLP